jgi:UPF0176 protein
MMNSERPASPSACVAVDPADAPVVNIAAYRFVALRDLDGRRERLRSICADLDLRGTILLSPEGVNLFLSGRRAAIDGFLAHLERDESLAGMTVKRSLSATQPFARMKVKLKREIIPFGIEGIDPVRLTAPPLAPETLRDWLSEGRDLTLLDVRNEYEIEYGTFAGARSLGLDHFRDLPAAVKRLGEDLRQRPLVMFCTGGIRCEKAGSYLQQQGFREVYQLDGGILQYFAECGGEHYEGDCFVFDERVAVDHQLRPVAGGGAGPSASLLTPPPVVNS